MRRSNAIAHVIVLGLLLSSIHSFGQPASTPNKRTPSTAQEKAETLPTEDQINLLVTQAERAFVMYEGTLEQETQLKGSNISVSQDRRVSNAAREVINHIKTNPQYFNAPMGFLLVGDLDDASRNMALCSGQAAMESITEIRGKGPTDSALDSATSKMRLAQRCTETSAMLQTVGETAFNLYAQYLSANFQAGEQMGGAIQKCMDTLQKCATALKKPHP
jgi:hypothetical protein